MTTKHEHAHSQEHASTTEVIPPDKLNAIATAAHNLVAAVDRLGPRISEHGYGCPAQHAGPCTCGTADFLAAMVALKAALLALPPQNGG